MRELITSGLKSLDEAQPSAAPIVAAASDYDLNERPARPRRLTPAAVLVPLIDNGGNFSVLLTQRTDHLSHHGGQISFPGGRAEANDSGPIATALRETEEEIGLSAPFVQAVGFLDMYETVTGFVVTPVVGFVRRGFRLQLDRFEVAETFEVPLAFLMDPANCQTHSRLVGGKARRYYVYEFEDRYIWGATAGMLVNLSRRLERAAAE